MEVQPWTIEGANQDFCTSVEIYDDDYYSFKLRNLAKRCGWRSPQYSIIPEKSPGKLCMHKCQLYVRTAPGIASPESKKFPQLKKQYDFDTGNERFLKPYEAMEYVAKIAFFTMKELTDISEKEND